MAQLCAEMTLYPGYPVDKRGGGRHNARAHPAQYAGFRSVGKSFTVPRMWFSDEKIIVVFQLSVYQLGDESRRSGKPSAHGNRTLPLPADSLHFC